MITLTSFIAFITCSPLGLILCSTAVSLSRGKEPHGIEKYLQVAKVVLVKVDGTIFTATDETLASNRP